MEISEITIIIAVGGFMIGLGMWLLYFPWRFQKEIDLLLTGRSKYNKKLANFITVMLDCTSKKNNPELHKKLQGKIRGELNAIVPQLATQFALEFNKQMKNALKQQGVDMEQVGQFVGGGGGMGGLGDLLMIAKQIFPDRFR